jgi:hypothetical protein
LNSKDTWSTHNGGFHADVFYQNVVDSFDDEKWAKETTEWWNR